MTRPAAEIQIDFSKGDYAIKIESTFDCVSDPILETPALKVLFKGKTVFESSQDVAADEPLTIAPLEGVEVGENEVYIAATRDGFDSGLAVLRVSVLRNDVLVAEELIAGEAGIDSVAGPVSFEIEPVQSSDSHSH